MGKSWNELVEEVIPYIVRISTPSGFGTGFFFTRSKNGNLDAIATAAHVIQHAHEWQEPIKLEHISSGKTLVLNPNQRNIYLDLDNDTGSIVIKSDLLPFQRKQLNFLPDNSFLSIGHEIGWLGFPAIANPDICFFSGRISSVLKIRHSYLVDGVAINGVSGGPAFFNDPDTTVIGVVSAYMPNFNTGNSLPGLSIIRDATLFQNMARAQEAKDTQSRD